MARVLLRTQAWGVVLDDAGNALSNLSYVLKNTDGSAATHWSAETGGTSSTASLTTDTDGGASLSGADRWVEAGEYDLTVNGRTYRVTTSGFPGWLPINVMSPAFGAKGDGVTDDTTALQNAINAASTIGTAIGAPAQLVIPSGAVCLTGPLTPKSYVDIWAYGAVLKRNPADVTDHPIFWCNPAVGAGSPITEFAVRGARMGGTGAETSFQGFMFISRSDHITVEDCHIHDLPAVGITLPDSQYLWVERNRLVNITVQNPINFVNGSYGSTLPLQHIWCDRNVVTGFNAIGICLVSSTGANRTDPIVDAHITDNTCEMAGGGTGWPMAVEQGGTGAAPNMSEIDISGNRLVQTNTNSYALVLTNDSSPQSNDPLCISDVTIRGNRLTALASGSIGLLCQASEAAITGNRIKANLHDIRLQGHGSAVVYKHTITGNVGHDGSGTEVNIFGSGVDTTQLSSTNTQ